MAGTGMTKEAHNVSCNNKGGQFMQSTKGRKRPKELPVTVSFKTWYDRRFRAGRFGWLGRWKVQRQIKDRFFRFLFEKDKEALLAL